VVGCCNASPLSASTVAVSMPLSMALVLSLVKFSPLSVRPRTKTYLMPPPPMRALFRQPLKVPLLSQPYRRLQLNMAPVSLPLVSLPSLRQSNTFAVHLPSLHSPLAFPAGIILVLIAPSSLLAPVPTGVSPPRPTTTWNFKCRQAQPQHTVLYSPIIPLSWLFKSFHCLT